MKGLDEMRKINDGNYCSSELSGGGCKAVAAVACNRACKCTGQPLCNRLQPPVACNPSATALQPLLSILKILFFAISFLR
jgi:hypothetical protein